ncbi:MAG: hypothetical protein B7Y45_01720 [Sphingomonas sp. 28-66-16]|nr:MAG: hypothetical protein B7Y45_01720 [Sphingomonas sp. 28-66-16]
MGRHRQWHASGWGAAILASVAIPFVLLVVLFQRPLGLKRSSDLNPVDVARYLSDFLDGSGGAWDWDDFTSISIADSELDSIRQEAGAVPLPLTTHGEAQMRALLARVRALEI